MSTNTVKMGPVFKLGAVLTLLLVVAAGEGAPEIAMNAANNKHYHPNNNMGKPSSIGPTRRRKSAQHNDHDGHQLQANQFENAEIDFEFGRASSASAGRLLEEVMDKEDIYRSVLDVDFMVSMSLSMSAVVRFPTNEPNSSPTEQPTMSVEPSQSLVPSVETGEPTVSVEPSESMVPTVEIGEPTVSTEPSESLVPTGPIITERTATGPCDGDPARITTARMEVVLGPGTPIFEYTTDLDVALTKALSSEYPLCTSVVRERLLERRRMLQGQGLHLGEIIVSDMGTECQAQVGTSSSCRNVQVDIEEYGGTGQENIIELIMFSIAENEDFDYELDQNGILGVSVVTENAVNESNSPTTGSNSSSHESLHAGTTAVVVVASLAAVTLIGAALMRRRSRMRRNGMAYTEALDDYECKSIDQASQSQETYDDTLPFAASVDSAGILGAVSRDYMPANYISAKLPDSPVSELRKRPSSP